MLKKLSSSLILAKHDSKKLLNLYRNVSSTFVNNNYKKNYTKSRQHEFSSSNLLKNETYLLLNEKLNYSISSNHLNNKEWTKILTNAEKIVGYPTSFLNLRYLVSDEVANFANLLRQLMKTKHPLINMVRKFIMASGGDSDSKRSLQINGIIILLIAKAAGMPKFNDHLLESDFSEGIHQSQRSLAEITEMIHMGSLIHKGIIDLKIINNSTEYTQMDQGNKLAVLCGDYLLASACNNLSKLKNTQVVSLMSKVIADMSQSLFINANSNSNSTSFVKSWYDNVNSNTSSLMANSAKAAMLLVSHKPQLQEISWNFAQQLDKAHKIYSEISDLKNNSEFLLKEDSLPNSVYKDKYLNNGVVLDDLKEKKVVSNSSTSIISSIYARFTSSPNFVDDALKESVIGDCKLIFLDHYSLAIENLEKLEKNEYSEKEAVQSLRSILNVMKDSI